MDLKKKRYILMFFMGMLYSSQNVMPWFSTYYYKAMQGPSAIQMASLEC